MNEYTVEQIKEDFEFLVTKLIGIHPNPFHSTSREELSKKLDTLAHKANALSEKDFFFALKIVLNSLNDSHTYVKGLNRLLSKEQYPFRVKYLNENLYIVACKKKYEELVGVKIHTMNGSSISFLLEKFMQIFPHENESILISNLEQWIYEPDLLRYLKIVSASLDLEIECQKENGEIKTVVLHPEELNEDQLLNPRSENIEQSETLNPKGSYWTKYYPDIYTYYLQYNECENISQEEINKIIDDILDHDVKNIIVDLRNNIGGSSRILDPLTKFIYNNQDKYTPYVFISNITYSAAIINALNILDCKNAVSIGTPTAGSPTKYGEATDIVLPNTGIKILIPTKTFIEKGYEYGEPLIPKILTIPSIGQYLNAVDVEWEAFVKHVKE